jgi:hypothetical protein
VLHAGLRKGDRAQMAIIGSFHSSSFSVFYDVCRLTEVSHVLLAEYLSETRGKVAQSQSQSQSQSPSQPTQPTQPTQPQQHGTEVKPSKN